MPVPKTLHLRYGGQTHESSIVIHNEIPRYMSVVIYLKSNLGRPGELAKFSLKFKNLYKKSFLTIKLPFDILIETLSKTI